MRMTDFDYRQLDEIIHSRIRLAVMALLARHQVLSFGELKELTKSTDGNLSIHLRKLEEVGYLEVQKQFIKRKPQTTYQLSSAGRVAFSAYVSKMQELLGGE